MTLAPFLREDPVVGSDQRLTPSWWNTFNSLWAFVRGHDTTLTTLVADLAALAPLATTVAAMQIEITALTARVVALEGGLADVAYDAALFGASGAMTWGVSSTAFQRARAGYHGPRWLVLTLEVFDSIIAGTPSGYLSYALPDGKVCDGRQWGEFTYEDAGANTDTTGMWYGFDGEPFLRLYKDYNGAAWTAGGGVDVALTARVLVR